jgi:hypothetical protein
MKYIFAVYICVIFWGVLQLGILLGKLVPSMRVDCTTAAFNADISVDQRKACRQMGSHAQ